LLAERRREEKLGAASYKTKDAAPNFSSPSFPCGENDAPKKLGKEVRQRDKLLFFMGQIIPIAEVGQKLRIKRGLTF
jgi:hypothetical protein